MMKYAISIDWLSLYCENYVLNDNSFYRFHKREVGTIIFKDVYDVYDTVSGELYAVVQKTPHSPILPKNATMVQVMNRWLYREDWNERVNHFCNTCFIVPKSISRIDICADFNEFADGYHPVQFINDIFNGKLIRKGGQKYAIDGNFKDSKFQIQGTQGKNRGVDYIRFGSRDAQCCAYLYNKTKELKEVHDKPYIREMWKESGIDTSRDVWRLEFSMKTTQLRIVEEQTAEILRLDLTYIKTKGILENIFDACVEKFFDIRVNTGIQRVDRMPKKKMFEGISSTILLKCPTNKACTGRMDKIIVKKLANAITEYRIDTWKDAQVLSNALAILLTQCDLWEYYNVKVSPYRALYKKR